jgi:uncharacterized protein YjcR
MAKKDIDWINIKNEYLTTSATYQELAIKYGVSFSSIEKKSRKEGWRKDRVEACEVIEKKVRKKITEKVANRIAKKIDLAADSTDKILKIINKTLDDSGQFNKHMIKLRQGYGKGEFDEELEIRQNEVIDAKRLNDLMSALEKAAKLKRLIEGIISEPEKQHIELEREKLELEKAKANVGLDDDDETGVVILPDVDGEQDG